MGQYYVPVNLDRFEALDAHKFGDGVKLMEFGMSSRGTLSALAACLTLNAQQAGSWAGQRIVIAGDYADEGRFVPPALASLNLYSVAHGAHLADNDEARARLETLPTQYRKPCTFVSVIAAREMLETLGIELELRGESSARVYRHLTNPSFVADQPEDLFAAFEVAPTEFLPLAVSELLTCLRMSAHKSDVSWCEADSASIQLDAAGQRATALTVVFRNPRAEKGQAASVTRTLSFPASQADLVRFFGLAPLTQDTTDQARG